MIDLHCHLLPGIDDGPTTLDVSLAMARCAVDDGITFTACTPHIYPGLYENNRAGIEAAVDALRLALAEAGIPLQLGTGADTHLAPDLAGGIRSGRVPTINGSRYLLLEPPHHVAPPRFDESVFNLMAAGIVPVITHPERLSWIETHYTVFADLVRQGAWMQLTAGSLTGRFGRRPKYWAERMLDEGLVHILATDSHHIDKRPPLLAEGREAAAARVGAEEATHMVLTRPQGILDDLPPGQLPPLPERPRAAESRPGFWQRLFGTA
ncbi:MAG TPA: CpsB/CapC family capsule biosynthesis tyrosine phosphatase [Arenimonas sp.]|uniref:tyrosine-protein phosphatase n=1 Tax=Arenimonas sp. TaxID=1872635 RepID=UPI002D804664|nr:CpsB/CapC family capsule biosynthesis tyrosine phosphatase [Arenimonas sp.]HEU0152044.1 CpsB/CapC family capsule biosynthesis tyrosine phosphatase [Arenimonas sp.]